MRQVMNQDIIKDILQGSDVLCPICKSNLKESQRDDEDEMVLRRYYCGKCGKELTVVNEMKPVRVSFENKTYQLYNSRGGPKLEEI